MRIICNCIVVLACSDVGGGHRSIFEKRDPNLSPRTSNVTAI
jgi:hypothetical protein